MSDGRARSLFTRIGRQLSACATLWRRLQTTRSTVAHIHTASGGSFFRGAVDLCVARLCGRRAILHIHGGRLEPFLAELGPLRRAAARWALRAADAVILLSHRSASAVQRFAPGARVAALPNPIAMGQPDGRSPAPGPIRFLFVGEIRRIKGIRELLEAAALLKARGVAFRLDVAGPQSAGDTTDWRAEASRMGLDDVVQFVGPVNAAERTAALRACDCLVVPSHFEAMPMVVLEAAAEGIAVVATAVGDLPELLRVDAADAPFAPYAIPLVTPQDVEGLAAALARIAADPALRADVAQRLANRVRERCECHVVVNQLATIYARAHHPAPPPRLDERLARRVTYPLHERLRALPTLATLSSLTQLAAASVEELSREVAQRRAALHAFARQRLPFYAGTTASCAADGAVVPFAVIDKATIRANPAGVQWADAPRRIATQSGGTSGDTLRFFVDPTRIAEDHAARLLMQSQFGVRPGDRRVHLWGSPLEQRSAPAKRLRDRLICEWLLDAFDLSAARADAYIERIRKIAPRVLYGYPSAVSLLAERAARRYRPEAFGFLRVVVLTGEEVQAAQRDCVARAFGAPVASEYGNREVGLIAHECPAGGLHIVAPHVSVEVLVGSRSAAAGEAGEIVCTTLNTRAQPFIRYRVGDVGRLLPGPCACGLRWPLMSIDGGRVTGFLALPDGRLCHGAAARYAMAGVRGLVAFRAHQRSLSRVEVLMQVDDAFEPESLDGVRAYYRKLAGADVDVECRVVDQIPPEPSGKRRYFVSDVAGTEAPAAFVCQVGENSGSTPRD